MPSRSRSTSATEVFARLRARAAVGDGEVPPAAQAYVDKVRRHAYKVTDADVDALRAAGMSEDAVFELTVAVALEAALSRRDIARKAMES